MFYGNQAHDTRTYFFTAWRKHLAQQPLDQLESQLLAVILQHPEYHVELAQQDGERQYHPELGLSNPFLHMGLHLALQDQILLDRPQGIKTVFEHLVRQHGDSHHAAHLCMEQLAQSLWNAQRRQCPPDEQAYLQTCQQLLEK